MCFVAKYCSYLLVAVEYCYLLALPTVAIHSCCTWLLFPEATPTVDIYPGYWLLLSNITIYCCKNTVTYVFQSKPFAQHTFLYPTVWDDHAWFSGLGLGRSKEQEQTLYKTTSVTAHRGGGGRARNFFNTKDMKIYEDIWHMTFDLTWHVHMFEQLTICGTAQKFLTCHTSRATQSTTDLSVPIKTVRTALFFCPTVWDDHAWFSSV